MGSTPTPKCWDFFHVTNQQKQTYCRHRAIAHIAHKRLKDVSCCQHVTRCVYENASKCVCGRSSAPDPVGGGLQHSPRHPIAGFGEGRNGTRKGKEIKGKGGKGKRSTPQTKILATTLCACGGCQSAQEFVRITIYCEQKPTKVANEI